jgi:hypothetical protein
MKAPAGTSHQITGMSAALPLNFCQATSKGTLLGLHSCGYAGGRVCVIMFLKNPTIFCEDF